MARSKRRRRRETGVGLQVLALVGILIVIAGTGGIFAWSFLAGQADLVDEATFCPKDGPPAHLAILVDTTDPVSLTQLEVARQQIEQKIADAVVGTRISFSTVSPDLGLRNQAFFSMCKPQAGDDASILTQNPQMVEEQFQAGFAGPVSQAMNTLLKVPEAPNSPIMESAQEFAARIPGFSVSNVPRELVLLSDLVQHSDSFSFYRGGTWDSFEAAGGTSRFGASFRGVTVSILRIPRLPERTAIVDDFWVRYFSAQGFESVRYIPLGNL